MESRGKLHRLLDIRHDIGLVRMIQMVKKVDIVNGPSARSTVSLDKQHCCIRCGARPRAHNQRWCRECRAAWKRERRRANTLSPVPPVPTTPGNIAGNTGELASPNTRTGANEALDAYRTALDEYERARGLDWRRQRHPPSNTLVPLWERVEAAKQRCLALGLSPHGEQQPPKPAHQP